VRVEPADQPGLSAWTALLPAAASRATWAAIDALGVEYLTACPELTPTQARADAFTDLILAHASVTTEAVLLIPTGQAPTVPAPANPPTGQGDPTRDLDVLHRIVHGSVSEVELTWVGEIDHAIRVDANPHLTRTHDGTVTFVPGPVTVPGIGSLLPQQVTTILADPDVRLRLAATHPATGAVHLLDSTAYRPGAHLARQVRLRDGTCRFPGCSTAAARCDLDHVTPHPHGPTTAANLQTLCRTHHGFKHHAGWTVTMTPDGTCTWTAPTGRSHSTHPQAAHDEAA
jgi:hypothetical protein